MNVVQAAKEFATRAHAGQQRKYTGQPYTTHPDRVVELLGTTATEVQIAAAWLHDTVEDTEATIEEIFQLFGPDVGALVAYLTDTTTLRDGNRAARKKLARDRLASAPLAAQQVKLADILANGECISLNDPDFWTVYLKEVLADVEAMDKVPECVRHAVWNKLYEFDKRSKEFTCL